MKDYYSILDLDRDASEDEIKRAYRSLAKKYHPDQNKDSDDDKFKEISEAYEVLSDASKRRDYDASYSSDPHNTFWDIYAKSNFSRPGKDSKATLYVTLDEVINGCKKNVVVPWNDSCKDCFGEGTKAGYSRSICQYCGGSGFVINSSKNGSFRIRHVCAGCMGKGHLIEEESKCPKCRGSGLYNNNKSISLDIPIGVPYDASFRMMGYGVKGHPQGPRGDLYVSIRYQEHEIFSFNKRDLVLDYPLRFSQAAFGNVIKVPTPYGPKSIKINPGTQDGHVEVLEGCGLPSMKTRIGDHPKGRLVVRFYVETPKMDEKNYSDLLTILNEIENSECLPRTFRDLEKIEDFLNKDE